MANNENDALQQLVEKGKKQGYLTYDDVTSFLPDEANGSEQLDRLIIALENSGIELCDEPPMGSDDEPSAEELLTAEDLKPEDLKAELEKSDVELRALQTAGKLPRPSDDPIRMYLSQMAQIPLLTREQEIALAKRIEIARKRYRRSVLSCNYALVSDSRYAEAGSPWRIAFRSYDQSLADRKVDQRANPGPHALPLQDD